MGQESGAPAAAQPEMLVEISPGGGAPLPALDAPPAAVIPPLDTPIAVKRRRKGLILIGMLGLAAALVNVFLGLGEFIPTCDPSVHITCGESLKLNWLDAYHRMNTSHGDPLVSGAFLTWWRPERVRCSCSSDSGSDEAVILMAATAGHASWARRSPRPTEGFLPRLRPSRNGTLHRRSG